MQLEAVTVCVNYGDFLAFTARENRGLFDRWIIVTTAKDCETREVARKYNLETVLTDDFHRGGDEGFAKARGINRGLNLLSNDGWRLHMDADIVLPRTFRHMLETAELQKPCIYGVDRAMVRSYEAWLKFKASGFLSHDFHSRVNFPNGYGVGTRWVSPHHGYCPIGYFQLWHANADEWRGIRHRRYPERHGNAARCDVQFALQWDRPHRVLLPEVLAIHLESEPCPTGKNWNGRKTKRFGPPPKPHPRPYC